MNYPTECAKCHGEVERGFMVDRGDSNIKSQAVWASGEPKISFWSATDIAKSERTLAVVTFRCTKCGYLESFAPQSG